jgi:aminoglycoside phosphotransferase (APT) family kinase protein
MAEPSADDIFARVARRIDPRSRLLRAWELTGGVSARVTALEIELPGGHRQKLLVRQHGAADLERNPRIAADEFRLLQLLHAAGVAAPRPHYLDQSGEIFATPYVVIEYIEGEPALAPADAANAVLQLATHLARIHAVDRARLDLSFLPRQEATIAQRLR